MNIWKLKVSIVSIAGLSALVLLAGTAHAAPSAGLAPTPPMGWNSWNWFGKQAINEQVVRECIDAMVEQGLRDAGYNYFVVDGGWRDTKLGPNGELLAHPVKFPHGMKTLAEYAHSKGLKFGVHTVPGTLDCGGDPVGGFGNEEVQVKQFADWGFDFIKLDKCRFSGGWKNDVLQTTYAKWSDLLARCGRSMVLSMSAYRFYDWYPKAGQMGRTTMDIACRIHGGANFDGPSNSVMQIASLNNRYADQAGPGYWNDPDMLITGDLALSGAEQQSHFALWCIMSAPLMLGDDPRALTVAEKTIILNRDAIAIDQDPTEQGREIKRDGDAEIWAKKLKNGRVAVLLLNRSATAKQPVTVNFSDLGLAGEVQVKNIYGPQKTETAKISLTKSTPPHACWLMILSVANK